MFGRVLTAILWGTVADRYGRKHVIMFGTFSVVVFNTLFGLGTNFWMAITTRFLLGCFNGLLGPMKAYACEVCRDKYQALSLSLLSIAKGVGLILGPALGGFLARWVHWVHEKWVPQIMIGPYFLPCLCISLYAAAACIASLWLPRSCKRSCNDLDVSFQSVWSS
ncbi:hypothetical protein MKW92_010470 [Papaver armeniacum]|nr:hypothetical protein MKW92_010470 [Papaver armeniacum]